MEKSLVSSPKKNHKQEVSSSPSDSFNEIYQERIRYHERCPAIYLTDLYDLAKGIRRIAKGVYGQPLPSLKFQLPSPQSIDHVEFVFLKVFLSRLYLNTQFMAIKSYCKRNRIRFFIPEISDVGSSYDNGKIIFKQLYDRYMRNGGRKFVLIGMSKGSIDGMSAIVFSNKSITFAEKNILALVSIGGSIGGSPFADLVSKKIDRLLGPRFVANGFNSLRTDVCKKKAGDFNKLCPSVIKLYSLSFYTEEFYKSLLALPTLYLNTVKKEKNDGFVLLEHTKIPSSTDLGNYPGDHSKLLPAFNRHHIELFESVLIYLRKDNVI